MKQLLFLLLFPCLAMAQYQGNAGQKITLGEQTTADGLVFRGVLADTGIITPSSDTSAYIILDTVNHRFYNYNRATNIWSVAGGGTAVTTFSAGSTGLTPNTATSGAVTLGGTLAVANGGTNRTTMPLGYILHGDGTSVDTSNQLFWDRSNNRLGVGTNNPVYKLDLQGSSSGAVFRMASNLANDILLYFTGTITGNLDMFTSAINATGNVQASFQNNNTSTGSAFQNIQVPNSSTGDPYLVFTTSGAQNYSLGIDNSDDDKFKLHAANNPSNASIAAFTITKDNLIGFGTELPTARLHLAAGTATASTAPLKFNSQGASLLNPVEPGAVEFNGTNLLFTPSATRHTVNHGLPGSATLDFPSTTTLLSADLTITVTGAADGDVVSLGVPNAAVNANTSYSAWVSAANTVTVRFNNYSSGTVDPASALFKVFVTK